MGFRSPDAGTVPVQCYMLVSGKPVDRRQAQTPIWAYSGGSQRADARSGARAPLQTMPNITLLGVVGDAAGMMLTKMACAKPDCSDAVLACRKMNGCDIVEHQFATTRPVLPRRRQRRARPPPQAVATLRAAWTTWGARNPKLSTEIERCQALTREAQSVLPGQWIHKARRLSWQQSYCDEYCACCNAALPDFGRELRLAELAAPPGALHCPAQGTRLVLITYQNGPSPWLCTLLRTLGYHDVAVTVLGWQPREFVRANNVFYFTDRVYTLLRYLLSCPSLASSGGTRILFCDVDELYQLDGGLAALAASADTLHRRTNSSVVISAEARCMPDRLGKKAWAHSEAVEHMHKKWPRCLNTGNFVGSYAATVEMLRQTCIPCRGGLHVNEVFRRYTRAYSYEVREWIYSEQAELMRLYLQRPANESGWILDYRQQLFHPNFWFTAAHDTILLNDGRIMNRHTSSMPAFIHYNGDSKRTWRGPYSPPALARALKRAYVARTGDARLERLSDYMKNSVSFLGPTFVRDKGVAFEDICQLGSIEDATWGSE